MEEKPAELPVSPQEIQIQPPSFLDKLKIHKFKILGGVLGLFVLAGVAFGAYKLGQKQVQPAPQPTPTPVVVATPTLEPTVDWKTYTNEKYGYSIKYPNEWFTEEKIDLVKFYNQDPNIHKFERTREVSAGVFDYPKEDFIFDIDILDSVIPEPRLTKKSSIRISELDGVKGTMTGGEGEKILMGYVVKDGKTYIFYGRPADSNYKDYFNLMLSTFKFLEEGASVEQWKTYTFPKTEFTKSFKLYYPQDWKLEIEPVIKLIKDESFFEIRQAAGSVGWCLFEDDKDNPNAPAFATLFGEYREIIKINKFVWRLASVKEPKQWDNTHILCEKKQGESFFHQETSLGYVPFRISSEDNQMLDEVVEILNKIEILD